MQYDIWEKEYRRLSLLTAKSEPQKDIIRFIKFLKRQRQTTPIGLRVLDLGSGTGRNTNFFQSLKNNCVGMEISDTAICMARKRARDDSLATIFINHNIGSLYPFDNNSFDLLLDITSSNSLNEEERNIYLKESHRVLKPTGYFFVKALCLDGDKNAHNLIKLSPGHSKDTYIMPELNLEEREFSHQDFIDTYSKYFKILKLGRKTSYTQFNGRSYKRNFWIAYLTK